MGLKLQHSDVHNGILLYLDLLLTAISAAPTDNVIDQTTTSTANIRSDSTNHSDVPDDRDAASGVDVILGAVHSPPGSAVTHSADEKHLWNVVNIYEPKEMPSQNIIFYAYIYG